MTRPLGLAFRLQRGALLGWTVALFLMGYIYGSIAEDIEQMLEENDVMADMFAAVGIGTLTDAFFSVAITQLALMAGGFAIASTLRLASEESAGRAESILAGATGRVAWSVSHLSIAIVGSVVTIGAAGLGLGIAYAAIANDAGQIPRLVGAALVAVPAVLILVGTTLLLFGAIPSATRAAWGVLGIIVVVGMFGDLLRLPEWARSISPFDHLPALPAEELTVTPLVILSAIAIGLIAMGLIAFRARDLRTE